MAKREERSIIKYVVLSQIGLIFFFLILPSIVGRFFGENMGYEFLLAIIIGLPLSIYIYSERKLQKMSLEINKIYMTLKSHGRQILKTKSKVKKL